MKMKKSLILCVTFVLSLVFTSCEMKSPPSSKTTPDVNITTLVNPSEGLDLKLVGNLFQKGEVKDANDLENYLNKENGINNIDLNSDNIVDFINVSENTSTNPNIKSFDLTTGKDSTDLTYIATVEVEKANDKYNIHMSGSESLYGSGHHYTSSFHSTSDMLFYAWLFSSRPHYYHSPYYLGNYPNYASNTNRTVVNNNTYINRTTTERTTANKNFTKTTDPKTKVPSKNKGAVSKSTRASINNHKTQVKKMEARKKADVRAKKMQKARNKTKPKAKTKSTSSRTRTRSRSSSRSRRSDTTYKENIVYINDGLDKVMRIEGIYYNWKDSDSVRIISGINVSDRQVGLNAQNIQELLPEAVDSDEYGLLVDYELVIPLLVNAIQTQQAQIDELEYKLSR